MDAFPGEGEICFPSMEDLGRAIYRKTWLGIIGRKLEALDDTKEDFGTRCNLVRQAYMEMGDIVLEAARQGGIVEPYFLPWNEFWKKSPPEFGLWCSIRYYGRMPLYPQYPVLNYFVDFEAPGVIAGKFTVSVPLGPSSPSIHGHELVIAALMRSALPWSPGSAVPRFCQSPTASQ